MKSSQIAKKHHFVPQCYLAGFTDTGAKDGMLCVYDFEAQRFFRQIPKNVAFEVAFNRVDLEDHPPDALERAFGEFEGRVASVVNRITAEHDLPEDEELRYVLNLIALLAVRNPAMRRSMETAQRHMYRVIGDMLASDSGQYKSQAKRARTNGFVTGKDVPYEQVKDFLRRDEYTVEFPPQYHLQRELAVFEKILTALGSRTWSLLTAAPDAPDFITCDHPGSLTHKQLLFPLDARHALMGDRQQRVPRSITLPEAGVAEVNLRMVNLSDRQLYCRTAEIALLAGENGAVIVPLDHLKIGSPN
jgi:hypothetical protein